MRRVVVWLLVAAVFSPRSAHAQSTSDYMVELRLGAGLGTEELGYTAPIDPAGYLRLAEVDASPFVGAGLIFPAAWLGVRPMLRVGYVMPAGVATNWIPCDPGAVCPSLLTTPSTDVRRLDAAAGLEFPILEAAGPVRFFGSVVAGLRWYGFSWDGWGEAGTFVLPSGSHWETDFLVGLGAGASARRGDWEVLVGLDVDWSRFGPGTVPVYTGYVPPSAVPTAVDLGRETITAATVELGIRRAL